MLSLFFTLGSGEILGFSYITQEDRKIIEKMYADGERVVDIAARVNKSHKSIYRELKRGCTGKLDKNKRLEYSAELGQTVLQKRFRRRGKPHTETEQK